MRLPASFLVVLSLVVAAAPAAAAPVCRERDDCSRLCDSGGGVAAACTQLGALLASGRGGEPERGRAVELWRSSCSRSDGDPAACLALAEAVTEGWMFEVPRDPGAAHVALDRGLALAGRGCDQGEATACAVAARLEVARPAGAPDAAAITALVARAERGCTGGAVDACVLIERQLLAWQERGLAAAEGTRLAGLARAGIMDACLVRKDGGACDLAAEHSLRGTEHSRLKAASEVSCTAGDAVGCIALVRLGIDEAEIAQTQAAVIEVRRLVGIAIKACETADHPACIEIVQVLLQGQEDLGVTADPRRARAYAERRCGRGDPASCELASMLWTGATQYELDGDPGKSQALATRVCMLSKAEDECPLCAGTPDAPVCQLRATFAAYQRCEGGALDACEDTARRFRDGVGVTRDGDRAARYFRQGCDAARKGACAALDELCLADGAVDRGLCVQSLVHTDLFYEAEWQFRATGQAQLLGEPGAAQPSTTAVAVAAAAATGGGYSRGHLDADLVVSVVLDRARQAAIRLVVDELDDARAGARALYLRDLLAQGARLLADPSTLRREKFADLAMTVVRAFVAANLVDTLYPDADAALAAPVVGAELAAAGDLLGVHRGGPLPSTVRTWLVDVAYVRLGDTHLFARALDEATASVPCPWPSGPGAKVCAALVEPAAAQRALAIDRVLEGVRLAKALRAAGTIDLRRLVDAVSRSRSVADLAATPGLVLGQWRAQLVDATRARIAALRGQLADLKLLVRARAYGDGGLDLAAIAAHLAGARAFVDSAAARLVLHADDRAQLGELLQVLAASNDAGLASAGVLASVRGQAATLLTGWGAGLGELIDRVTELEQAAAVGAPALEQLERSIWTIEAIFARVRQDGVGPLDLAGVPLHAVGELRDAYRDAVAALTALDGQLRLLFPGEDSARLQFARSAAIRLLGLLDLLERVARTSPLQETAGDVVGALRLLGSQRHGEFAAPLFDVVDPVLDAIKTHEPMSVDLLFAVISRVRLDSLVASLQGGGRACARDGSVDCWTVKIIHALQESVEREGDLIRVDGGKFAQRLAAHGDDFRRRHRWRGYFHLTVGVGAMRSQPPGEAARRDVPVVAEQLGFGWASPSVWKDRLTFKVGAAASGVLYRALLDSSETDAIMLHPALFAVDVYDLVELYASPATILVYPPAEGRSTALRWGPSVGLSVPLSAYLERL